MSTATTLVPPKTKSQLLRSFDVADFPALTGREEEWRFTPLKRLRGLATVDGPTVTRRRRRDGTRPPPGSRCPLWTALGRHAGRRALVPFDRVSALAYRRARRRCRDSPGEGGGRRAGPVTVVSADGRRPRRTATPSRHRRAGRGHRGLGAHRFGHAGRQRRGAGRRRRPADPGYGGQLGARRRAAAAPQVPAGPRCPDPARAGRRSVAIWCASTRASTTPVAGARPSSTGSTSPTPTSTWSTACWSTTRCPTAGPM